MFWNKSKSDKRAKKNTSCVGREGQSPNREEIHAQALANARLAKENLGDETIQKIVAAMEKQQNSIMAKAKRDIEGADVDRVLDELKFMLDSKHSN